MSNQLIRRYALYILLMGIMQIPLLHNWVLFNVGFPFPYVGILLLLPVQFSRGGDLVVAFVMGLVVDLFSNTPGVHAAAAVLVAYLRIPWLSAMTDLTDEDLDLSIAYLGFLKFTILIFPLIFLHHFVLFTLENEGFGLFSLLISKIFWSSVFSYILVAIIGFAITPLKKRI